MDHDVTYECWYGADDAAPEDIERIRRKQKMDLLLGAGAFSKAMKGITKTTNKWKKKAHTRITEVISFPLSSCDVCSSLLSANLPSHVAFCFAKLVLCFSFRRLLCLNYVLVCAFWLFLFTSVGAVEGNDWTCMGPLCCGF